ncbi:hypothetical protein NEOLEDRAFT_1240189 [Neolentinus lepideus HHB14362 ss-1]|uniref:F-box domain-containing protein n=1 Tax=Neolentinus lepideus HHB14362 ss-1 TaxID=1314782 RepID=A0A165U4J5_9AGAM|nr:hypothetical protein NEOLEDRAFT_1240189 [Neolentinus lepideus HHB14362 ss-1]
MSLLWENLDTLVPLLQLVPGLQPVNGTYVPESQISTADLMVFYHYAAHVRRLVYTRNLNVPESLLLKICATPAHRHVFPKLRNLYLWGDGISRELMLFRTPSMQDLTIGTDKESWQQADLEVLKSFFGQLPSFATHLISLRMAVPVSGYMVKTIPALKRLCMLYFRDPQSPPARVVLDRETFAAISQMEHITDLRIEAPEPFVPPVAPAFARLEKLELFGHLQSVLAALETCSLSNLINLRIISGYHPSNVAYHRTLFSSISWLHLTYLHIRLAGTSSDYPLLGEEVFSPSCLLKLRHMQQFFLRLEGGLSLIYNNEDVNRIAKAWPKVQKIGIVQDPVDDPKTLPNLEALAIFARCSLDLMSLTMVLNAREPVLAEPPVTLHRLGFLNLLHSPTSDVAYVARFIHCVFPCFYPCSLLTKDSSQEWRQIARALEQFQQIIMDERRRANFGMELFRANQGKT